VKPVDLYTGISDIKKASQPKTKIAKDEKDDLITYSHSILPRWRKHSLSFPIYGINNVNGINNVRQIEIHRAQPHCCLSLVPWMLSWLLKS
jgi:hypothetical protein